MGAGGMDRDESRSKPPALTRSTDPVQDQILANREVCVLPLLAVPLYYERISYISISSKAKARVFLLQLHQFSSPELFKHRYISC